MSKMDRYQFAREDLAKIHVLDLPFRHEGRGFRSLDVVNLAVLLCKLQALRTLTITFTHNEWSWGTANDLFLASGADRVVRMMKAGKVPRSLLRVWLLGMLIDMNLEGALGSVEMTWRLGL